MSNSDVFPLAPKPVRVPFRTMVFEPDEFVRASAGLEEVLGIYRRRPTLAEILIGTHRDATLIFARLLACAVADLVLNHAEQAETFAAAGRRSDGTVTVGIRGPRKHTLDAFSREHAAVLTRSMEQLPEPAVDASREIFGWTTALMREEYEVRVSLANSLAGNILAAAQRVEPAEIQVGADIGVHGRCLAMEDARLVWVAGRFLEEAASG